MDRKTMIDLELQKCMEELERAGRPVVLKAVATPAVGRTPAYYIQSDGDIHVENLRRAQSCLSGNLYRAGEVSDYKITSRIVHKTNGIVPVKLVVHSTRNKKNADTVCAISVFETHNDEDIFKGYLFTTNDPLAFDNFNCFRGSAPFEASPMLKCVEQKVFCENKVKMAKVFLATKNYQTLYDFVMDEANFIKYELISELFKDAALNFEIKTLKASNGRREAMSKCLKAARTFLATKSTPQELFQRYSEFLDRSLSLDSNLVPKDNYKDVGSYVILDQATLAQWDEISMMCAVSARMHLLSESSYERGLCAAMIPECVIEISEHDDKWAHKLPEKTAMKYFIDDGFGDLLSAVLKDIHYQNDFISRVQSSIDNQMHDQAFAILFNPNNERLLGLSEKIIQSVWTGKLVLDRTMLGLISEKLKPFGINFHYFNPTLIPSAHSAFTVASAIGIPIG